VVFDRREVTLLIRRARTNRPPPGVHQETTIPLRPSPDLFALVRHVRLIRRVYAVNSNFRRLIRDEIDHLLTIQRLALLRRLSKTLQNLPRRKDGMPLPAHVHRRPA